MFLEIDIVNDKMELNIKPEALTFKPVKALLDYNKGDLNRTYGELAYVFYMVDVRSIYNYITNEEERHEAIIDVLDKQYLPSGWKPSKKVKELMEFYEEQQNKNDIVSMFRTAKKSFNKFKKFIEEIDFGERIENKDGTLGSLLYNPKQISDIFNGLPNIAKTLLNAEKEVLLALSEDEEDNEDKGLLEDYGAD